MTSPASNAIRFFATVFPLLLLVGSSGATDRPQLEAYIETIPGTTVTFEMIPVPAGTFVVSGAGGGERELEVRPFWIGKTEVTWDEYDVWNLRLDQQRPIPIGADAESRPSRPYGAPDRGFGHSGFAAISVTFHAAEEYARWLSEKTGRRYRLPTEAEWLYACELGGEGARPGGLDAVAWYGDNAGGTTHPVAAKAADGAGLFDMLGNAAEWASGFERPPAVHGGSFHDDATAIGCDARAEQAPAWNRTDPQLPKSTWWLSDGDFVGFRIVRDPEEGENNE